MNYELRKVKFFDEMSEETPCFKAEIWENGKHVADVKNDGRGGCNDIYVVSKENRGDIYNKYMALEFELMERADEIDQVRKLQTKSFVLKKDGKLHTSKFNLPLSILKKDRMYDSWKTKMLLHFTDSGYEVMNINL